MGTTARPGPANLRKVRAVTGVYTLTTALRSDIHHGRAFSCCFQSTNQVRDLYCSVRRIAAIVR